MTDTGYDDPHDGVEDTERQKSWTLDPVPFPYPHTGSQVLAQLRCNSTVRANIYLDDEEEYEWLKARVTGVQPSTPRVIE